MPQRDGLDPVRHRVARDAAQGIAFDSLLTRFPALGDPEATPLHERFVRGEIVRADGTAWAADAPVEPGDELWFHRELREEAVPEVDLPILHQDDHLLVVDKPHDMATMPRGTHVLSSALVRLRRSTGITTLSPLHRLDRRTAGVLAFGVRPADRSVYQELFARRAAHKEYLARVRLAARPAGSAVPRGIAGSGDAPVTLRVGARAVLRDRLLKERGDLLTRVVEGEPNAITELEVLAQADDGTATLLLRPLTGRTHQLRAQLSHRGMPILGEDLYPSPLDPDGQLQLLARTLAFTDPVTGQDLRLRSNRELP